MTMMVMRVCVWSSAEAGGVRGADERGVRRLTGGRRTCSRRLRRLLRRQRFPTHQRGRRHSFTAHYS